MSQRQISTILIPDYKNPHAIIAGLTKAGFDAIAEVASGAVWEAETNLKISNDRQPHARIMAKIWHRAAQHQEGWLKTTPIANRDEATTLLLVKQTPGTMISIPLAYKKPRAIIAALWSAAHEAISQTAKGAVWEGETEIQIPARAAQHAHDMARIWRQAADRLEAADRKVPWRSKRAVKHDQQRRTF